MRKTLPQLHTHPTHPHTDLHISTHQHAYSTQVHSHRQTSTEAHRHAHNHRTTSDPHTCTKMYTPTKGPGQAHTHTHLHTRTHRPTQAGAISQSRRQPHDTEARLGSEAALTLWESDSVRLLPTTSHFTCLVSPQVFSQPMSLSAWKASGTVTGLSSNLHANQSVLGLRQQRLFLSAE